MPRKFIFVLVLAIILSACAPTPATQTSEVSETSEVLPTTVISAPTSTPEPPQPTETVAPEFPTAILAELGYDANDHESFAPTNYRIETRQWQGVDTQMLIHTDPTTKEERVDGMEVTINGQTEWVRGLWYETRLYPGSGGVTFDILDTPQQSVRGYLSSAEAANDLYGELLHAVANQRGISFENVWEYIQTHGYKLSMRMPENAKAGSKQSPSTLRPSPLVEVDFSKPIIHSFRAESYAGQHIAGAEIPESAMYITGDSRTRSAWFVVNGQLNNAYVDYRDGANIVRVSSYDFTLFYDFELLARMSDGFIDSGNMNDNLISRVGRLIGKSYVSGVTILNRNIFVIYKSDYSGHDYSLIELR